MRLSCALLLSASFTYLLIFAVSVLSYRQTAQFFHQFAALLRAGLPVDQSLLMAGKHHAAVFRRYLQAASAQIAVGRSLGEALQAGTEAAQFDLWTLRLLHMGEVSGTLADTCQCLAMLAETYQHRSRLYGSILTSITVILFSLTILGMVLLQKSTAVIFSPMMLGLVLVFVGTRLVLAMLPNSTTNRLGYQVSSLVSPLQPLAQVRSLIVFSELSIALQSGLSMLESLHLTCPRILYPPLQAALKVAIRDVKVGYQLSHSLRKYIPATALQFIVTGEETGRLDTMLTKLGDYYNAELSRMLQQWEGMLRPLSMVAIAGLVLLAGLQVYGTLMNQLNL